MRPLSDVLHRNAVFQLFGFLGSFTVAHGSTQNKQCILHSNELAAEVWLASFTGGGSPSSLFRFFLFKYPCFFIQVSLFFYPCFFFYLWLLGMYLFMQFSCVFKINEDRIVSGLVCNSSFLFLPFFLIVSNRVSVINFKLMSSPTKL